MGIKNTLIYIDDEEDLLEIFEILNSSLPVDLKTFNDSRQGLEFINSFSGSSKLLIFCDVTMPQIDGVKLKSLIKQDVEFYFVTADPFFKLKDVNEENILSKPLSPDTVKDICEKVFSK